MDIRQAIQDFLTAHEIDNCRPSTIKNYRRDLFHFANWVQSTHGVTDTDELTVTHLRGWIGFFQKTPNQRGEKRSDASIRSYGIDLLAFCRWLEREEVLVKPISTRFRLPRVEEKFIPTFTSEDVQKLLDACEDGNKQKPQLSKALTARNRAIVSVLIDTGIRRSELAGLRLCDVDRELRLLVVHRKGNKWQQVPISRDGFKPLHEYLIKSRPYLAKLGGKTVARREDAVFLSDEGEPLTVEGVAKLFQRLARRTGIEGKRISPHNCRRYMATTQLANGRSPLDVQRQMGHTTLTMTNRYASLTTQQLQRSHEEFSPLRARSIIEAKGGGTGYWDE
jgi:site-specific recombinase XerD